MIPKRTLFFIIFTTFVMPQIICIRLQQNPIIKHYAEAGILQQRQSPILATGNGMLTAAENVTILPELATQSTLARKFDETDWNLIPENGRIFFDSITKTIKSTIRKLFLKVKTAFGIVKWWEPELDFGNCIVESVFNVNPKAKLRSFGLKIMKTLFNLVRSQLSKLSMKNNHHEPDPNYYVESYPPQIVFTAPAAVVAEQAYEQHHQRPSFFFKRRRRQGRSHQNPFLPEEKENEGTINNSNYDQEFNKISINKSDDRNLKATGVRDENKRNRNKKINKFHQRTSFPPVTATKNYVQSSEQHLNKNIIVNLDGTDINTMRKPLKHNHYDNKNNRKEMIDVNKNKNNENSMKILSGSKKLMNINETVFITAQNAERMKRNVREFPAYTGGGIDAAEINALERSDTEVLDPQESSYSSLSHQYQVNPQHTEISYPQHTKVSYPQQTKVSYPQQKKVSYPHQTKVPYPQQKKVSYPQVSHQKVSYTPDLHPQASNPQYSYQDYVSQYDVNPYAGPVIDTEEYINSRPITVDLVETYSNWMSDYEGIILSKFGLEDKHKKPNGFVNCAQEYTLTLVVRFFQTLLGKIILGKKK